MASLAFPTYAYQNVAPFGSQLVQTQAALTALGSTWSTSPTAAPPPSTVPFDPGFPDTDTRLQQILIEMRVANLMAAQAYQVTDDPTTTLRADVVANDVSLSS